MLGPVARLLPGPRSATQRFLRRHRRPTAAVLAALGALVALTALRTSPPPPAGLSPNEQVDSTVRTGEVLVPVALASAAIAATLDVGDVIDLVGLTGADRVTAEVVMRHVRVVEVPSPGSALSGTSSGVVLVAVPESQALKLSAASANGGLMVVIRSGASGH